MYSNVMLFTWSIPSGKLKQPNVYMSRKKRNWLGKASCKETVAHWVLKSEKRQVKSNLNLVLLTLPVGRVLLYFSIQYLLKLKTSNAPLALLLQNFSPIQRKQTLRSDFLPWAQLKGLLILLCHSVKLLVPSLMTTSISSSLAKHLRGWKDSLENLPD